MGNDSHNDSHNGSHNECCLIISGVLQSLCSASSLSPFSQACCGGSTRDSAVLGLTRGRSLLAGDILGNELPEAGMRRR